jgi:tRNA dimethylallyltransferase
MNIGTAKPSSEELAEAPHHFIGNISINDHYTAGIFEKEALALLEKLFSEKDIVILIGGSGLFERAIVDGLDDLPPTSVELRNSIQDELNEKGIKHLQSRLKELDEGTYNCIDLNNPRRVQRALEIVMSGKGKASELRSFSKKDRKFKTIRVGLNAHRESLYDRINLRVEMMISAGLEEEARGLFSQRDKQALQTVGYKELFDYFEGKTEFDEAVELIKRNTRRYAKRQLTWFRKYSDIEWFQPDNPVAIIDYINTKHKNESN